VFSKVDARIYQSYENYKFEAGLRGERATLRGYLADLFNGEPSPPMPAEQTAKPAPPFIRRPPMPRGSTVGRIEIPRISVSTLVREGSDDKTLKRAAGHVPYTALPGEHGNVGIAAHRDSFFRNLRNVREGDVIRMETSWGLYEYEVEALNIVMPENVEVLHPTPAPSLTLVTCYPFNYVGSAPKRFIVRARQVNPPVVAAGKTGRSAELRKTPSASHGS
jgi:LPXTG-site transpeptidase (sortase) family protein